MHVIIKKKSKLWKLLTTHLRIIYAYTVLYFLWLLWVVIIQITWKMIASHTHGHLTDLLSGWFNYGNFFSRELMRSLHSDLQNLWWSQKHDN